jgi:hypothetical protein
VCVWVCVCGGGWVCVCVWTKSVKRATGKLASGKTAYYELSIETATMWPLSAVPSMQLARVITLVVSDVSVMMPSPYFKMKSLLLFLAMQFHLNP